MMYVLLSFSSANVPFLDDFRKQLSLANKEDGEADMDEQGGVHAEQEPNLLGTTENELGIRKWIEDQGHTLVTTSDKEGESSKFDQELVDAEVIITTPYAVHSHFLLIDIPILIHIHIVSTQATSRPNASPKLRS
jgi:hypothetical protein